LPDESATLTVSGCYTTEVTCSDLDLPLLESSFQFHVLGIPVGHIEGFDRSLHVTSVVLWIASIDNDNIGELSSEPRRLSIRKYQCGSSELGDPLDKPFRIDSLRGSLESSPILSLFTD
jgi:hypothetical protein